jgi:hypothetical protein
MDRCPNCGWTDRPRDEYDRGRDFGWRGTELDRGFAGRYGYDRDREGERNRYRDDDRYRYSSGDPYMDRGYERDRDDSERFRDRDRGYWDRRWRT